SLRRFAASAGRECEGTTHDPPTGEPPRALIQLQRIRPTGDARLGGIRGMRVVSHGGPVAVKVNTAERLR
ncbi:MAG: hypothetical protein ACOVO0_10825, partial [Burkholderiaceae bacterium]